MDKDEFIDLLTETLIAHPDWEIDVVGCMVSIVTQNYSSRRQSKVPPSDISGRTLPIVRTTPPVPDNKEPQPSHVVFRNGIAWLMSTLFDRDGTALVRLLHHAPNPLRPTDRMIEIYELPADGIDGRLGAQRAVIHCFASATLGPTLQMCSAANLEARWLAALDRWYRNQGYHFEVDRS